MVIISPVAWMQLCGADSSCHNQPADVPGIDPRQIIPHTPPPLPHKPLKTFPRPSLTANVQPIYTLLPPFSN